jgi:hypothetical protein
VLEPKHGHCDVARIGASEAHYTDSASAGRSGDRYDGVIEIQ